MQEIGNGFSFVWKIENFSMLPHRLGEKLSSPTFVVDIWKKVTFYLDLYPRGYNEKEYLSLYLCKEPIRLDLKVNFTFAVESTELSQSIMLPIKGHVLKNNWGFARTMSLNDLYNKKKLYLPDDTLTLICEINPVEETPTELVVNPPIVYLTTCIQVQRRSFMWAIRNVKERIELSEKDHILLTSPLKNSPRLKLTLDFKKSGGSDDISILIKQTCLFSKDERLFVQCKITVTSVPEEYQVSKTSSHFFTFSTCEVWSYPPFITHTMLAEEKILGVTDTLFLWCEFTFSYKDGVRHSSYKDDQDNNPPCKRQKTNNLSTCFENIYSSGQFCDIELKAGGRTFPYYKLVLCARSSVFAAMFKNNMREKESNVVEIYDVDPDTLQKMLTFLHSDVLQEALSSEDICKLYRVADKYDISPLKDRCRDLMVTTVSVLNVCDVLVLADSHLDSFLMTTVSNFICSHTTEVFHSVQWESFMKDNPKLSCYIMHKMWTGVGQI